MGTGIRTAFIIFVSIFTISLSSFAAEQITYRDAIRDALNRSARIKVKAADIHISDALYRQNFAGLYPVISANSRMERYENLDRRSQEGISSIAGEVVGGDPSAWRTGVYLLGEYSLSNWYKKRYEVSYFEKMKDAGVYDCESEAKKLLRELTDAYGALAESGIKWRYGCNILNKLKEILVLRKQAFSAGQVSYEEVLKTESDVITADRELSGVRKEMMENLEKIRSYTGNAYRFNIAVEGFDVNGQRQFADAGKAVEDAPEYKARIKELEAVRNRAKAATNNFWPDVSLYGRYDYYGSSGTGSLDSSLRDLKETSYRAGLQISLPIFDGGVKKWERAKSDYEIRKQEESVKAVAEEKVREIKMLSAGHAELSKALAHYGKLADQCAKLLEIARKSHGLGEKSMIDILEMEKESLTVEREMKVTEQTAAAYGKRLFLETDFTQFMMEHYGDWTCKH